MTQTQHYTKNAFAVIAVLGLLSGCNWVDSTGRQSNSKPTIILNDGTPEDGFSLAINEEGTGVIDTSKSSDDDGAIISWSWNKSTVAAGALAPCNSVDGFNAKLAAQSLNDACTDSTNCEIQVISEEVEKTEEELTEDQANLDASGSTETASSLKTVFTVTAPKLKAPVGLTYRVTARDNDGDTGFAEVTLCLIAINEAPEAVDDNFTVLEGVRKEVLGTSPVNLLSNDEDDIDVSNRPLAVNPTPVSLPNTTNGFSLGTDGGFTYFYPGDPSRPPGDETFDEFEYEISDGIHTSQAKVTLRIVSIDDAPVLTSKIPNFTFYEGIARSVNFGKYFVDPEGATLIFSESNNALPASFDRARLIKGFLESTPLRSEIDQYSIVLSASDDLSTTSSDPVVLTIAKNQKPSFSNIPNQTGALGKPFALDLTKYASDPEGQPLTYKLLAGPTFFKIQGATLAGTPTISNSWRVTISVSDNYNTPAETESFTFTVINQPPVLSGPIPDQTAAIGQRFTLDASRYFSDPEGQKLNYSISPANTYLSISDNGVISGTPTNANTVNVTVQASDGEKSVTDTFTLRISNPPPVLTSSIPNQTYTAGNVVNNVNFAQYFNDPNGDQLTFSATGLPPSNQIKISAAGVMSGSAISTDAGSYNVTVTASDGSGEAKGSFTLTINQQPNTAPTLTSSGAGGTVTAGDTVSFASTFNDADPGDTLTISGTTDGSGLSVSQSGNNGVLSGTANKVGTFTIRVTARDASGASITDQYTVTVVAANNAPTITLKGGGGTAADGETVSYKTTFSDPDSDPLTLDWELDGSGLAASKSGNSVVVSGTAVNSGTTNKTYTIKVFATDPGNLSVTDTYEIVVTPAPGNTAPSRVGKAASQVINLGDTTGNFVSSFSDPDAGDTPLTLTLDDGGASFLSMTVSGNTATVSGTANIAGTFTIVVTATDKGGLSATDQYTLTVNP